MCNIYGSSFPILPSSVAIVPRSSYDSLAGKGAMAEVSTIAEVVKSKLAHLS